MNGLNVQVSDKQDSIEKFVYLDAHVPEVWQSIVDADQFGKWFCVRLDAPFRVSEITHGHSTYPGCEHLRWRAVTETLDHERLLAFTWWPAPEDVPFDESSHLGTRVEILIRATVDGTRVTFGESGFDRIDDHHAREKLKIVRTQGWHIQAENIRRYFSK